MSWVEEALHLRDDMKARDAAVSSKEIAVFEGLWDEMKLRLAELKKSFPALTWNGEPLAHLIQIPTDPVPPKNVGHPRRLYVVLQRQSHTVDVFLETEPGKRRSKPQTSFVIACTDHRDVRLTLNDEVISYASASKYLLWPFMFPELPLPEYRSADELIT